jgi:transposase InsO family protein
LNVGFIQAELKQEAVRRVMELGQNSVLALLIAWDIDVNMSRTGNCWDNSMMESFFGTHKTERVYQEHYQTKQQARRDVIAWIEGWYNTRRRHSAINYLSPEAFEARMN